MKTLATGTSIDQPSGVRPDVMIPSPLATSLWFALGNSISVIRPVRKFIGQWWIVPSLITAVGMLALVSFAPNAFLNASPRPWMTVRS